MEHMDRFKPTNQNKISSSPYYTCVVATLRSRATFNPDTSATHHSRLFVMVRRRKRMNIPHSDITKILRPSTIPYALAAAGCLYISYQFSKRIGEPNERVQRRRKKYMKQKAPKATRTVEKIDGEDVDVE